MFEISGELWALLGIAFSVAVVHSLSPDHWLPFVMLGRAREWGVPRTLGIAGIAGSLHVGTSIAIGLIGLFLGTVLAEEFASVVEYITGSLLFVFGLGFAFFSWRRKNAHTHRGIPLINRLFRVNTEEAEKLMHVHDEGEEHAHDEHDDHDDHDDHDHDDDHDHEHHEEHRHGGAGKAGYGLVAIIGLTPCVALLPIVFAGTTQGINAVITLMVVFFVATLATILIATGLATKGLQLIRLNFFEKHGEVFTGLIIALMGIIVVGMAF